MKVSIRLAIVALVAGLAISGCGSLAEEDAKTNPCNAATIAESERQRTRFEEECRRQKDVEAAKREAEVEVEAIREGERLRREGR
ncbi:MAG: hypothetical protein ACYCU0_03195 [Solirubrobacteraceae bacterium]